MIHWSSRRFEAVRNVLVGIWDNKENVIRLFETHTRNEAGALIQKLNQLLPAKKSEISSKTHGMEACSLMLVGLYHLFDAFLCLKSSDRIPNELKRLMEMMGHVKSRVFEAKIDAKKASFLDDSTERNRPFLVNASVPSQGYTECVLCSHSFVDFPNANASVNERNKKKLTEYEAAKKAVSEEKNAHKDSIKVSVILCFKLFFELFYILHSLLFRECLDILSSNIISWFVTVLKCLVSIG